MKSVKTLVESAAQIVAGPALSLLLGEGIFEFLRTSKQCADLRGAQDAGPKRDNVEHVDELGQHARDLIHIRLRQLLFLFEVD